MEFSYKTRGVCSQYINFELNDGIVTNVQFLGGCNGNLKGIAALVEGMDIDDVISRVEGILCGPKAMYAFADGELAKLNLKRRRIRKELANAEKQLAGQIAKLANENFVSRAPEHVVADIRDKAEKAKELADSMGMTRIRLLPMGNVAARWAPVAAVYSSKARPISGCFASCSRLPTMRSRVPGAKIST